MSDPSPSTPKAVTGIAALSVRETEILGKAWSCLKTGPPDIDYEKLAGELGMANPRSAANAWGSIKKKMAWSTTATPGSSKSTSAKRKKAAAPKAPINNSSDASDEESDNGSPISKKKMKAVAKPKASRKKAIPKVANIPVVATNSGNDKQGSVGQSHQQAETEPKIKAEPDVEEYNSADDVV